MQETNDHFIVQVLNKKPIVIQKFDTPLQIAHKFCCDNALELRHCRNISRTVIRLMKTYLADFPSLQLFQRYFENSTPLPKKPYYLLEDFLDQLQVYRSPKEQDMSKKLYQRILSPPPEQSFKQRIAQKIFNQLDHDKDGYISPQQIDISSLPDELLKQVFPLNSHLIGVLLKIDHDNLTLNGDQFCSLFSLHYDKLNSIQKQRFMSIK